MHKKTCPICQMEVTVGVDRRFWAHGEITEDTEPGTIDWCPMSSKPSDARGWWFREVRPLPRHERAGYVVELYRAGLITDYQLWEILGLYASPVPVRDAMWAYFELGFKPFAGYPLTLLDEG